MSNFNQPKIDFEIIIKKREKVVSRTCLKSNPEIDLLFDAFTLMLKDLGFSEKEIRQETLKRYYNLHSLDPDKR